MLKRIKSILLSVAILAGMSVQISAVSVYAQNIPEPSENQADVQPVSDISSEHAYNPIAELEAEKQYRESTTVAENKIIFSVIDQRPDKSKAVYLKDSDSVCKVQFTEFGPGKSKGVGRRVQLRPDWEDVKTGIMEEIVRAKFTQHPELAARLLATGDKVLVEGNHWGDTCWGVDTRTGQGENRLGKILMKVREELKKAYEA